VGRNKKFFRKIEKCQKLLSFCAEILPFLRAKLEHKTQVPKAQVHKSEVKEVY
jgi:hypothetical protein